MNHSSTENHSSATVPRAVVLADISLLVIGYLAGTFGNGRACLLLRKRRDLRKAPHFLFANLSVVGFLFSLVNFFGWLVLIILCHILNFKVPEVLCLIITPFVFACIMLNAMTLSLMAIDRQDCVLRPFDRRITPNNVKTVILVVWLVAFVFALAFIFFEAFAKDPVCRNFDPYTLIGKLASRKVFLTYFVGTSMLLNLATVLTIVVTFIRIFKKLRSSPIPLSHSVQNRREQEITNFTYRSCAMFAVCCLPGFICNLLVRFGGFDGDEMKAAQLLTVTIAKFTVVVNPFLHYKILKARTANKVAPVASLNSRRTLAGVHHPAGHAVVPLQDIGNFAHLLGSVVEEQQEVPSASTGRNSQNVSAPEPGTKTP